MRKVTLIAIALLAASTLAFAGDVQMVKGKVLEVSGNMVTVAGDNGEEWSFEATTDTKVIAEGASNKKKALAGVGMKTTVGSLVHEGQLVTVKYWEDGDTRYIKKLRVH